MAIIELKKVSFRYSLNNEFSLTDINLSVEKGEVCAVTGATESGKTTLCHLLCGLIPHFTKGELTGSIIIDGINTTKSDLRKISSKVGFVMQNPKNQLSGIRFTVFEEVGFSLENSGVPKALMEKKINEALDLLGIFELSDKNPVFLSGGQLQRLAVASVLVTDPDILILDSPFSQLDPAGAQVLMKTLGNLSDNGTTIFITGPDPALMCELADQVIVLYQGSGTLQGKTGDVCSSEEIKLYGVSRPLCTEIAAEAVKKEMWPKNRTLPVTIKEATKGFKQWITQ